MKQPPITDAPLGWLVAVTTDLPDEPDDKMLDIQIQSVDDGKDYTFHYKLGDIRLELRRRKSN